MREKLQRAISKLLLSRDFVLMLIFIYFFFIAWQVFLSFTDSKLHPFYGWLGEGEPRHWNTAIANLAIFGFLYIFICTIIGLLLAILLDWQIRIKGILRPLYLYPMVLSFIVAGTVWQWFLYPDIGVEHIIQSWGFEEFSFRLIESRSMAISCVVLAAGWQTSGFVMAMFLAGLRGISEKIFMSARIDGANSRRLYLRVMLPLLKPVFLLVFVILGHLVIEFYAPVIALTTGGPGQATEFLANSYTFTRNRPDLGVASSIVMLLMIPSIIVPYLYAKFRSQFKRP